MKNEDASLTGLWRWNDVLFKHVSTTTSDTSTKEALKKKRKKKTSSHLCLNCLEHGSHFND